jgi:dUTP pyrophosphatase
MLICKQLDPKAILPTVAHPNEDLAFDVYALQDVWLYQNMTAKVRTGISAKYISDKTNMFGEECDEYNYGLMLKDRSSMASNGITISGGVIDSTYTGEILVLLTNHNPDGFVIKTGDKIAQMIPLKVLTGTEIKWVDELPNSKRAEKGFGSSGR